MEVSWDNLLHMIDTHQSNEREINLLDVEEVFLDDGIINEKGGIKRNFKEMCSKNIHGKNESDNEGSLNTQKKYKFV